MPDPMPPFIFDVDNDSFPSNFVAYKIYFHCQKRILS